MTLKDVGTTDPISGRYLNEMPGIDTDQFDLIKPEESYSLEAAWDDIERRAISKFETILNRWGVKYFKNYSYIENIVTGQYSTNDAVPIGSSLRGYLLKDFTSSQVNQAVNVQFVHLYSTVDIDSVIYIYNATTGDLLDAITHSFVSGQINKVTINKQYPLWKYPNLFICYNDADIASKKASNLGYDRLNNLSSGKVSNTASVVTGNISDVGSTGQGLIVSYSINCAWDNFISQRMQIFEEPYMYLLAAEFCYERIFSDRINKYTLLNKPQAEESLAYFQDEGNSMLENTLKGMVVDYGHNDICFQCDRAVTYRHAIP